MATSTSTPTTGPDPACASAEWRGEPLYAGSIRLRPIRVEDAGRVAELAGDWDVARWTARIPHPLSLAQARAYIANLEDERVFAIERLADGEFLGAASVRGEEIGYWIGRPHWGRGYGTEAVRRLTRLMFQAFGAEKVAAGIMADNPASARVLEKAGFAFACDAVGYEGRCGGVSTRTYAITRAEWTAAWNARPTLLVVAVALVDADGRVLMAQRPPTSSMAGLWEFPGGKVDAGELPATALRRELAEELGIDVTESCLAPLVFADHDYETFHLLMPVFACRVWKGTVTPQEGQAVRWVRPARIADLPMPPADIHLAAMVRDIL